MTISCPPQYQFSFHLSESRFLDMEQRGSQVLMLKIQLPLQLHLPPILVFQRKLMHTFIWKGDNIIKQSRHGLFPYKDVAIKNNILKLFVEKFITHPKCSL